MFKLNRDWYAKIEHDDNEELIYRPTPLEDVCIDEQGFCDSRHKFENRRRRREDCI